MTYLFIYIVYNICSHVQRSRIFIMCICFKEILEKMGEKGFWKAIHIKIKDTLMIKFLAFIVISNYKHVFVNLNFIITFLAIVVSPYLLWIFKCIMLIKLSVKIVIYKLHIYKLHFSVLFGAITFISSSAVTKQTCGMLYEWLKNFVLTIYTCTCIWICPLIY